MTDRFENVIMRLFIMRIGKSKNQTWRVVYGVFTPCLENGTGWTWNGDLSRDDAWYKKLYPLCLLSDDESYPPAHP